MTAMSERQDGGEREDRLRRQKRTRNWVMLVALLAFVVVIYFVALAKMGGL